MNQKRCKVWRMISFLCNREQFDITTLDSGAADGIDAVAGTAIMTLIGTDVTALTSANFAFVA